MKVPEGEQSIPPVVFINDVTKSLRKYFVGWLIVSLIWATDNSLRPLLLRLIINSGNNGFTDPRLPALLYVFTSGFIVLVSRVYDWLILKIMPELKKSIVNYMVVSMMSWPQEFYQSNLSGSLSNKINDVVVAVPLLIYVVIDVVLFNIFSFLMAFYAYSLVDYRISLFVVIWLAVVSLVMIKVMKQSQELSDQSAEIWSGVFGRVVDIMSNMSSVRFFSTRTLEHDMLRSALTSAVKVEQDKNYFFLKLYAFQGSSFVGLQIICLWVLINGLYSGTTTIGDFAMILSINTSLADCLWTISQNFTLFNENLGKLYQGLRVTSVSEIRDDCNIDAQLLVSRGEIVFDNVSFRYKGLPFLFHKQSLTIHAGQKVGLVGPSGSGKSTFINLILRLFDVCEGRILLDNQDISRVSRDSIGRAVSMIPQDPPMFHRSVLENIRYGMPSATNQEIIEAAKKAYVHDFIESLPEGYDSLVGERGARLSGGQRQRIAIARAILKNAPILILDEATSALDSITELQVQQSLIDLMQHKTTIVVTHKLSTLVNMDRILVFSFGTIVEDGKHAVLVSQNGGIYNNLWSAQEGVSKMGIY